MFLPFKSQYKSSSAIFLLNQPKVDFQGLKLWNHIYVKHALDFFLDRLFNPLCPIVCMEGSIAKSQDQIATHYTFLETEDDKGPNALFKVWLPRAEGLEPHVCQACPGLPLGPCFLPIMPNLLYGRRNSKITGPNSINSLHFLQEIEDDKRPNTLFGTKMIEPSDFGWRSWKISTCVAACSEVYLTKHSQIWVYNAVSSPYASLVAE